MSEEKPDNPTPPPNSSWNGFNDLLKSINNLSESSLLKQIVGEGSIEDDNRFRVYVITIATIGYLLLITAIFTLLPEDKLMYSIIALGPVLFVGLVFWFRRETIQKAYSSRANIDIYLRVQDIDDNETIVGARITVEAVKLIEAETNESGRATITIPNNDEEMTFTVKKEGYEAVLDHSFSDEEKAKIARGFLITIPLRKKTREDWLDRFRESLYMKLLNVDFNDKQLIHIRFHDALKPYISELDNMTPDIEKQLAEIFEETLNRVLAEREHSSINTSDPKTVNIDSSETDSATSQHRYDQFIITILKDYLSTPKDINLKNRYEIGKILGRSEAFESEIFEFTDIIERSIEDNVVKFKAMKFLVTNELFSRYSNMDVSFDESTRYYPYQLPYIEGKSIEQLIKTFIDPFMRELGAKHKHKVTFRLPTYNEWLLLATKNGTAEGWSRNILERCNFPLDWSFKGELCSTGIFPNGVSDAGCFDIVGNAWELCIDSMNTDKHYFVGASYQTGNHVDPADLNWWMIKEILKPDSSKDHCISFRVIQEVK